MINFKVINVNSFVYEFTEFNSNVLLFITQKETGKLVKKLRFNNSNLCNILQTKFLHLIKEVK